MYLPKLLQFTLLASFAATPTFAQDKITEAKAVFAQLASLEGLWQSQRQDSQTAIEMKLIANDSALVETWTMSPTKQSMTVYVLDGERLLATHYCPQGNAPRLAYSHTDATGAFHFSFVDGANLQPPNAYHEHAFTLHIGADAVVTRSETYIRNDETFDPQKHQGNTETFTRANAFN